MGLTSVVRPALSGQSFWTLWAWYLAAITAAFALAFGLTWLMAGQAPDLLGLVFQAAVTAILFPLSWRLIDAFEDADIRFK